MAEGRIYDLFINQRYAECHGIDTMSNGSISPGLGEMWRQGYLVSPQWEGELELDSASDCDNEYEEGDRLVARNLATENEWLTGLHQCCKGKLAMDLDPGLP